MTPDYPAAHSMDSEWFAVDACGHVGFFQTGEAGAMPREAGIGGQGEGWDLLERLRELFPPGEVIYDPDAVWPPGTPARHFTWRLPQQMLMFLDDARPLAAELAAGRAQLLSATRGVAVELELDQATSDRLHDESRGGLCRGCRPLFGDAELEPARLGLFAYSHEMFENGLPGPYGALERPQNPITSAQLPADVRGAVEALRFPFCFAKYPLFQPADHVACDAWTGYYLSNDLRTLRAFPGEAERARGELADDGPDPEMTVDLDRSWAPLPLPPDPQPPADADRDG